MEDVYRAMTVNDLIKFIETHKEDFPKGLDTVIMSGDFEGNYTHEKHEFQLIDNVPDYGNVVCLGYEMHENYELYFDDDEE